MYPSTATARPVIDNLSAILAATPQTTITTTPSGVALTTTTTTTATSIASPSTPAPKMTSLPADRSQLAKLLVNAELTGMSALHQAIFNGDYDMALALIDAGSYLGSTIKLPASERNNVDSFSPAFAIVHATEEVANGKNNKNKTDDAKGESLAKTKAVPLTQGNIVEFALYLANLAPGGCIEVMGANALTLSVLRKVPQDFIKKLFEAVARQHPALINAPDQAGRTPLSTAISQDDHALVKLLLELGTNPNATDTQGRTPLTIAASQGDAKIVELAKARSMLENSIMEIRAAAGLKTMLTVFREELSQAHLNRMLLRAAVLNDESAVDLMIEAGAKTMTDHVASIGGISLAMTSPSAVVEAVKHQNIAILAKLVRAGASIGDQEERFAMRLSREFGERVADLSNASQ